MKRFSRYFLLSPAAFLLIAILIATFLYRGGKPLTREQAQAIARETYERVYGWTKEESEQWTLAETRELTGEDGVAYGYRFTYTGEGASFDVTVNSTDGVAEADAQPRPNTVNTEATNALAEWETERGDSFAFWSIEDKARFAGQYYADSTVPERYCGVPCAGELPEAEALERARAYAGNALSLTDGELDGLSVSAWFFRDRPNADGAERSTYEFVFWRRTEAGLEYCIQIGLDAVTGEPVDYYRLTN